MKIAHRFCAAALALCLAASAAALPAAADEISISGGVPGYNQEVTTPVSTATPAPSATPAPRTSPEPTTDPYSNTGVYVVAATVTDTAGNEVSTVDWYDTVNVVLRVVDHSSAKFSVEADQISARVNSSVFTYTGNGEISQLVEGEDEEGPYYSYVLLFRDVIYNGGGNTFPINLSYLDSSLPMQQFSVTLGQCVDEDPEDPSKVRTPNLVIRSSSYGNAAIVAGSPFSLSLTAYATDGSENLSDVIISVTLPDGVSLTGGSLSSYVGEMTPKSTRDVTFSIMPSASYQTNVADITVNMTGTGVLTGKAVTGTTTISVPISQPDRFELGQLELTDTIYVGDSTSVTLNFVNKGKNPVSNLEASISGENLGADITQQYIGNVNAGTENSVDFDLMPTQAGPLSGTITLTYESADGSIKTVTKDFSATVMEMPTYDDPGMMDPGMEAPQQTGIPVWGWVLIVAAVLVVVAIVVVLVVRKRRKAAAIAQLEEADDEDL